MITKTFSIKNLDQNNAHKLDEVIRDVWGVRNVKVNWTTGEVKFSYDEEAGSEEDFQQAVIDSGFIFHD